MFLCVWTDVLCLSLLEISSERRYERERKRKRERCRDLLRYKDIWYVLPGKLQKLFPPSHLSLPLAAHIFSSTHYFPLSRRHAPAFPPSRSTFLAFSPRSCADSPPPFQLLLPNISFSSPALISAALFPLVIFVPLLPLSSSLIFCLPSPNPSSSDFQPRHHHHLPH